MLGVQRTTHQKPKVYALASTSDHGQGCTGTTSTIPATIVCPYNPHLGVPFVSIRNKSWDKIKTFRLSRQKGAEDSSASTKNTLTHALVPAAPLIPMTDASHSPPRNLRRFARQSTPERGRRHQEGHRFDQLNGPVMGQRCLIASAWRTSAVGTKLPQPIGRWAPQTTHHKPNTLGTPCAVSSAWEP